MCIAFKESDSEDDNDEEDEAIGHEQIHYIIQYVTGFGVFVKSLTVRHLH